jgi:hypothetical protein
MMLPLLHLLGGKGLQTSRQSGKIHHDQAIAVRPDHDLRTSVSKLALMTDRGLVKQSPRASREFT